MKRPWTELTIYTQEYLDGSNPEECYECVNFSGKDADGTTCTQCNGTGKFEASPTIPLRDFLEMSTKYHFEFPAAVLGVGTETGCTFDGSVFRCGEYLKIGPTPEAATETTSNDVDWTGFAEIWDRVIDAASRGTR